MGKNVLVLTGSPRSGGNSELLAEAFRRGAEAAGHTVVMFNTAARKIAGCRACDKCWSREHACVFVDGFTELEPLLEAAEVLVFATPLYWFGFSAQLKAAIDRMYAYAMPQRRVSLKIKQSVLLVAAAGDDPVIFDGALGTYRGIISYLGWKDAGILTAPGVKAPGDIRQMPVLEQAAELGTRL